jgi:hypothetical protein
MLTASTGVQEAVDAMTFAPCPQCGRELQHATWTPLLGWQPLVPPGEPVTGRPHVCPAPAERRA